jgi:predicted nicotinamide N-methyase
MSAPSQARLRGFITRTTDLRPVADLPDIRLHTASDVMALMALTGRELGLADPPLPFWAFPWAGGLGVARYVAAHPETVAGRSVLDLATGSGLCAIVAARAGAAHVAAADIDPFAEAAVTLNARANEVEIAFMRGDLTQGSPPDAEVILAGDVCYESAMAAAIVPWLERAAGSGSTVYLGDPGRTYLPQGLTEVGRYRVRTTRELEPTTERDVGVYRMGAALPL